MSGNSKIRARRDTSATWAAVNPVLAVGEIGFDTTLKQFKVGDGTTPWNGLPFAGGGGTGYTGSAGAQGYTGSAGIGGGANNIATRTALAAVSGAVLGDTRYLTETNREGTFVLDVKSNWTSAVTADTAQGIFVASTADTTKVWRRVFFGDAYARWFGFVADDNQTTTTPTDNAPALTAALACLYALRVTGGHVNAYGAGGSVGLCIQGAGFVGSMITINHIIRFYGNSSMGGGGSQLRWPAGTSGILINTTAGGTIIEKLTLQGGWNYDDEGEYHAIQNYISCIRRDLFISNWQGDGIYDVNDAGSTSGTHNSNQDLIERCSIQNCRRGIYTQGGDVNAKEIRGITCISDRWAGIYESGFLGNSFYACMMESNGFYPGWGTGAANRPVSYVSYNGKVWACVGGQETWCATNPPPSTSAVYNQGWVWHPGFATGIAIGAYAPTGIPEWFNGITVRAGGGYIHQGDSNRSTFHGIYSESNQMNQFDTNVGVIHGQIDYAIYVNKSSGTFTYNSPTMSYGPPLQSGGSHRYNPSFVGNVFTFYGYSGGWGYPSTAYHPQTDALYTFYATNYSTDIWFRSLGQGSDILDASINAGLNYLNLSGRSGIRLGANSAWRVYVEPSAMYPATDNTYPLGTSGNRWSVVYAGTATINTSDERYKTGITEVNDEVLDAWGEVNWTQYQFTDSVEKKKDQARVHFGLIAQRVKKIFKKHKIDPFKFGLLCYDEWDDVLQPVTEKKEREQTFEETDPENEAKTITVTKTVEYDSIVTDENGNPKMKVVTPAGNRYGVRYTEALALEAAYQRRRAEKIESRLDAIEKALNPK
jgi:hypothetical protein